jgi:rRNA maturation endonuclease Nob1
MIHKNMGKKYAFLMIGIMLIVMVSLFMILGESAAGAMVTGYMILFMVAMMGIYFLAMFLLMKSKKGGHHHKMKCVKCGEELSPGNLICPSCGHENKMNDFHGKHMSSDNR